MLGLELLISIRWSVVNFGKLFFLHTFLSIVDLMFRFCLQLPYITAVLTDAKVGAEGRKDLFDWLSRQLAGLAEFPDAIQLLKPTSSAMTVFLSAKWLFPGLLPVSS